MSDKKETLREEIERRRREIDELGRKNWSENREPGSYHRRDTTKLSAPEQWPDPPEDEEEDSKGKR
uniref:Uncharacterized protein n=1 Tax=Candidatus Kentrum sp. LFY TaxID=2126342 RepID=A0A450WKE6_9GAMM|nr:MAG: hypothetical protein BECKLFY1418C_GA0070996_103228 [Candidatus Kentron sp. LFY]